MWQSNWAACCVATGPRDGGWGRFNAGDKGADHAAHKAKAYEYGWKVADYLDGFSNIIWGFGQDTVPTRSARVGAVNAANNAAKYVDEADLMIWETGCGTSPDANHPQGDADFDQDVDGADFLVWQRNFARAGETGPFQQSTDTQAIVSIEAENFHEHTARNGNQWTISTSQSGFSGTGMLEVTGTGANNIQTDFATTSPQLDFEVNFVATGTLDAVYKFDPEGNSSFPLRGQGITIPTLDAVFTEFVAKKQPNAIIWIELKDDADFTPAQNQGLYDRLIELIGQHNLWNEAHVEVSSTADAEQLIQRDARVKVAYRSKKVDEVRAALNYAPYVRIGVASTIASQVADEVHDAGKSSMSPIKTSRPTSCTN